MLRTYYTSLTAGLDYAWETLNVRRIGHLDLPIKYQLNYSFDRAAVKVEETKLLQRIATHGFGLDLNTAGLRKPECKAIYTSTIWQQARDLNIPSRSGPMHMSRSMWRPDLMLSHKKKPRSFERGFFQTAI